MQEFNYVIIGGGCAGLSLAYELEINEKLKDKTLAIIEPREEYKKDRLGHFGKSLLIILMIVLKRVGKIFQLIFQKKPII